MTVMINSSMHPNQANYCKVKCQAPNAVIVHFHQLMPSIGSVHNMFMELNDNEVLALIEQLVSAVEHSATLLANSPEGPRRG